ncbi:unnamed protein product [Phytophthora lilii]|uniref:Unnamed protein product n=1 Tax=Phytophthora lilii TaxID=2077276 RepID=A0A9W6TGH0_9STRA|nr:unnamed protein product [Phytophthora lilii]
MNEACAAAIEVPDTETCYPTNTSSSGSDATAATTATGSDRNLRRMEDASNSDVQDLETYFGESLVTDFTTLKNEYSEGAAPKTPWPGSYWPTYQDGINVIWKSGEKSASEKYAIAYGLEPTDFKNKVSANTGIDSRSSSTKCTVDTDCKSRNDGSVCAIRKGASSGYCIPTWYGICHAWSPAALLEDEPKCDVVKNGQTFHVMDIKALITDIYDGSEITTIFTGARFNGPDTPVSMDDYGRYKSAARRDLGAGFFHLAISNILGKNKQSFVLDVTAGSQVWNQPVRSYSVQTMELVDADEASQQYFGTTPYPFNSEKVYLAYVKTTLSWIVEAYADGPLVATQKVDSYTVSDDYEYLLELDANYAVVGGEWVGPSTKDHPDFLWFPTAKPDASTVTSTGLSYANVQELLEMSLSCEASASASEDASEATSASISSSSSEDGSAGDVTSASASASTATSVSGTNEDATVGSDASTTSGEGSYEARSASETGSAESSSDDGSAGVTPGGKGKGGNSSGSTTKGKGGNSSGSTTDATDTYSSRSSTGSTEEDTPASLPSGKDALILTPSTTVPNTSTNEESTAATEAPIDTGYYTPPPTTKGQDLADVIDTIKTPDSSSSPVQETVTNAPPTSQQETTSTTTTTTTDSSQQEPTPATTATQTSAHNSCK